VVVLRHAKPDALMPKMDPQAIRIEFDPPDPEEPGVYDTIRFEEDQIEDKASAAADGLTQAERLVAALRQQGPMSEGEIAEWLRIRPNYVRRLVQKAREKGQTIVNEDKKYSLLK
jgi:DNA-directed RNA polymerase specialized sigma24 family protein